MDQFLAIGDVIAAKIWSIKGRGIDLMMDGKGLGKLEGGYMFRISATRIPRVIGREGSMIMIIKEHTSCSVTAGQNGWVWVNGPSVESVFRARRAMEIATPDYSGVGTVTAINNRHVGEFGVSGDNRRNYSFVGRDGRIIPI